MPILRAELLLLGDVSDMAYEDTVEVLKDEPENFFGTCVKAKSMFRMGNFEKSLMIWHKAEKLRPNMQEVRSFFSSLQYKIKLRLKMPSKILGKQSTDLYKAALMPRTLQEL